VKPLSIEYTFHGGPNEDVLVDRKRCRSDAAARQHAAKLADRLGGYICVSRNGRRIVSVNENWSEPS
jgi:hypothetical protein